MIDIPLQPIRAWDNEKNLMLYDNIPFIKQGDNLITAVTIDEETFYTLDVMYSTSFCDINDNFIFEGDVIECWNDDGFLENFNKISTFIVEFYKGEWMGRHYGMNSDMLLKELNKFKFHKVIGNIFENPELREFQINKIN